MPTSNRGRAGPKTKKEITPKTFRGMSKKRMEAGGGNFGVRVPLKENITVPVQFLETPEEADEFEVHAFQEEGRWEFVPCAGDNCPLCQSDSDKVRKTSYRFMLNVYNLEAKKVQILEGPRNLAQPVFYRYERKPSAFLKRTFEITRFPTSPVSYQFELGEEPTIDTSRLKLIDHEEYLIGEMKRYYGEDLPDGQGTSLDDDDEEDERPRRSSSSHNRTRRNRR